MNQMISGFDAIFRRGRVTCAAVCVSTVFVQAMPSTQIWFLFALHCNIIYEMVGESEERVEIW